MKKTFFSIFVVFLASCSSVYYNFWEALGKEKRDLLKSNMLKTQQDQSEVKKEFKNTLERIRSEYSFKEGELEKTYDRLSSDLEDAESKTTTLNNRIKKVKSIAYDLFKEWKKEALSLSNYKYKTQSLSKLNVTKKRFYQTSATTDKVKKNLDKVLKKFKDRVLFLKHNLNAKAVGSLKTEFNDIEKDMKALIKDIEASNRAQKTFINQMM